MGLVGLRLLVGGIGGSRLDAQLVEAEERQRQHTDDGEDDAVAGVRWS